GRKKRKEERREGEKGRREKEGAGREQGDWRELRQGRELSTLLASKVANRARGRMAEGRSSAGWRDLALAIQMDNTLPEVARLQREFAERSLYQAEELLAAGSTDAAVERLRNLARRNFDSAPRRSLEKVALEILQSERLLAEGKAAEARESLPAVDKHRVALASRIEKLQSQCEEHSRGSQGLLTAMEAGDWSKVLSAADQLLAIAPCDRIARAARRKAWHAVGLDATAAHRPLAKDRASFALRQTDAARCSNTPDDTMPGSTPPNRFLIWVDSVGGYLVCTDDEVVLGQPSPGSAIAVPLLADLSRRHAILRREGAAYTLEPLGEVSVDGRKLSGPMVLGGEHEIQLGGTVRMRFVKPHALSATARLTLISHHRTEPRADAVLLMADSCVLGPKSHCHIECRGWPGDVVLFRRGEELCCRSSSPLTVGGVEVVGPTPIELGSRLEGEDFALSLERA
ncbi:MAG: hypothetical protein ACR2NU_14285, partial [Aeoliella sp.]